ncbi:hypothetical protein FRC01_004361 [Tulasnella sp. 417]|nr:hypothetical protein FRC01_004361 [Tulasnella sp. 417]
MASQFPERLTKLPAVPKQFGDDGGHFYKYYDELAGELDEDMVTSLKSQLDGILIFAGLFAGVNSAFLAFTLPQMSADPADDTNALLFQIMRGANGTITSPADLPSASFSPPTGALPINILFSMSLTLALLASFLAVLGQQWLVYYRKRSGGGAGFQRWEQLRRYLGAKRWRLELVLDDILPSVLQIALVIFCVAFILYLGTLSKSLCYAIAAPLCIAGLLILAMAICAAWDRWCPFRSPLSHVVQPFLRLLIRIIGSIVAPPASFAVMAFRWLVHIYQSGFIPFAITVVEESQTKTLSFSEGARWMVRSIEEWFKRKCQRSAEPPNQLELIAVKRVLCTSEDSNAITHAAINGQAIFDKPLIRQIMDDDECKTRIQTLYRSLGLSIDHDQIHLSAVASLFFHVVLRCGSMEEFIQPDEITSSSYRVPEETDSELLLFDRGPGHTELAHALDLFGIRVANGYFPWLAIEELKDCATLPASTFNAVKETGRSPVGPLWFMAFATTHWKALDSSDTLEDDATRQLTSWREILAAYQRQQDLDQSSIVEAISEAIATLDSHWKGQPPSHEFYVNLFERGVLECPPDVVLRRARDPASPVLERRSAREYCIRVVSNFALMAWPSTSSRFAILEASGSIKAHIDWMKGIISEDSTNPCNPSMVESFRAVFGIFPNIDAITPVLEVFDEDTRENYPKLYSVLLGAMNEIEATISSAAGFISEEELAVSKLEPRIKVKQQSLVDFSLELWGN